MPASSAVQELKSRFHGELILPGDQHYETARAVFNAAIDRRPAVIARCVGSADVIEAVNFARRENLLVAVRGTGHNVAGFAVCDHGIVIDLSAMKDIRVDAPARSVRVDAGWQGLAVHARGRNAKRHDAGQDRRGRRDAVPRG